MTPAQRWTVVGVIVLIIALLWLFWPKGEPKPAPVKGPAVAQPAATPPAAAPTTAGSLTATALFDYDSAVLRPAEAAKLDELAGKVKGRSSDRLDAVGHADRIGSDPFNMDLSRRRAEAVRNYLVGKGIDAGRVRAEARGESEAASGTACQKMGPESRSNRKLVECLQRDRRVEIRLAARP